MYVKASASLTTQKIVESGVEELRAALAFSMCLFSAFVLKNRCDVDFIILLGNQLEIHRRERRRDTWYDELKRAHCFRSDCRDEG